MGGKKSIKKFLIIVAGGSGKRMNSPLPKQFLLLNGKPLLIHTIRAFTSVIPEINIILVLPENQIAYWKKLCAAYNFYEEITIVKGGKERFHSVKNGLDKIKTEGVVAVHDGVRPFVSEKLITACFAVAQKKGNAVPAVSVKETLRKMENNDSWTVDRSQYVLIQTPQCFKLSLLKKAYLQQFSSRFTDDASVVENTGVKINLVKGEYGNSKITTAEDFEWAERFFI